MKLTLEKNIYEKWLGNQIEFLRALAIFVLMLYVGFVIPRIEDQGFQLTDLVPTNSVITAIALYLFNALYDYLRKLRG